MIVNLGRQRRNRKVIICVGMVNFRVRPAIAIAIARAILQAPGAIAEKFGRESRGLGC